MRDNTSTLVDGTFALSGENSATGGKRSITFTVNPSFPLTESQSPFTVTVEAVTAATSDFTAADVLHFSIDDTAPAAPSITVPAEGANLNSASVTISGTAEPNSVVTIGEGATTIESNVTVDGSGNWTRVHAFPTGNSTPHAITATATDATLNVSAASAARSFKVDTVSPTVSLDTVTTPSTVTAPHFTGTAGTATDDATSVTVKVYPGGSPTGMPVQTLAASISVGAYDVQPSSLADGTYTAQTEQSDAAGNVGTSAARTFVVDTTAPNAPAIGSPADGSHFNNPTVTISGTAEPNSTVELKDNALTIEAAVAVNGSGSWSVSHTFASGNSTAHPITATATDASGNTSAASAAVTFNTDTVAPAAPSISAPAAGANLNNATATIAGTAEPNAVVTIKEGGTTIESNVTVDGSGNWSRAHAFSAGNSTPHTITATATDAANNISATSSSVTFNTDTVAPNAPVISAPSAGANLNTSSVTISGTAEANATIAIIESGSTIDTTTADGSGNWSKTHTFTDGAHSITATATDAANNTGAASSARSFNVDTVAPDTTITSQPVDPTSATSASFTFSSNEGTATFQCQLDAGAFASCASPRSYSSLGDGAHTFTVKASDAAGNVDATPASYAWTVDTAGPTITLTAVASPTNDSTPDFTGTAGNAAGDSTTVSVRVYAGPNTSGTLEQTLTGSRDGAGAFTITASSLSEGRHTAQASQSDAAGNVSNSGTSTFIVDTTAPTVVGTNPANNASRQSVTSVAATYNEQLTGASLQVFNKVNTLVAGSASFSGSTVTFTPAGGSLTEAASPYTARTTGTDLGGTTSAQYSFTFTVDATAPAAPAITAPANNASLNTSSVTISGTSEPNATIAITEGATTLETFAADGSGTWSKAHTFPDGSHSVTATATDAAGNTSAVSTARAFSIDTSAPSAPAITAPAANSTFGSSSVTITGTAEANSVISLIEGGSQIDSATADASGAWSKSHTFAEGSHSVTATATDGAGNTGPASAARSFTVDTTAPAAPSITTPAANVLLNTSSVTISGTAEANATVTIKEGASTLETVSADGSGAWSKVHTFSDGAHSITATATDGAANTGPATEARAFTVDTAAPTAPSITAPANNASLNTASVTISGTSEPNATITITEGATLLETVAADGSGAWSKAHAFSDGSHSVTATATDAAGNASTASAARSFTVDLTAPAAPVISAPAANAVLASSSVTISGTAEANATVTIKEGATTLETVVAGASGAWSKGHTFSEGTHSVTATATDGAGNTGSASEARSFTVDTTAPAAPTIATPAANALSNTSSVTISGTAEANATVTIKEGASTLGTTTADATGTWSKVHTFTDGSHTVTAIATDGATNTGPASAGRTFTVDTHANPPIILTPANGTSVNSHSPRMAGTAEANASVTLKESGMTFATTIANGSGFWSVTPVTSFADGSHTISATQTDPAGNVSAPTSSTFVVDTIAPPAPVITTPANGSSLGTADVTIAGTAEKGTSIRVTEGSQQIGFAITDGSTGQWSVKPTFTDGSHTVSVKAFDDGGNASPGASVTFNVITKPVTSPTVNSPAEGAHVGSSSVTISGKADTNVTLDIAEDAAGATSIGTSSSLGHASPDTNGNWTFTHTFADGTHNLTITATNPVGRSASTKISFTVDTVAPQAPTITDPQPGTTLTNPSVTFSGTSESHATISIREQGLPVIGTTADDNGSWSVSTTIDNGTHTVSAVATDGAGNASPASTEVTFKVDASAPVVRITTANLTPFVLNDVKIDGTANDNDTVTSVTVRFTNPTGATVATVDATLTPGPQASWSVTTSLPAGAYTATATAVDEAGNRSAPVSITIASVNPPAASRGRSNRSAHARPSKAPAVTVRPTPAPALTVRRLLAQ